MRTWRAVARGFRFLALAVALLGAIARAEVPRYTLEDCLRIGLVRSAALRNAVRDREMAEATIGEIGAQVWPQVSAHAAYTRLDEVESVQFGDESLELGALDNYSARLSLRQLVYAGGSVRAALQAARNYRDLETYQLDQVRTTLIHEIRAGFIDLQLLDAAVGVQAQTVAQLQALVARTEARFARDQASEFDLLNARVQLRNALPDQVRAENDLAVAKAAFRNLIGLEQTEFDLKGDLEQIAQWMPPPLPEASDAAVEMPSLASLQATALGQRPELRVLERLVSLRTSDVRAEQGGYLPAIHLTADYRGENPANMLSADDDWSWRWQAGLQLSWNLLDGGLRRHTVRRKRLERDKAHETLDDARRRVELDVRQAALRLQHAEATLAAAGDNVELAERSLQIAETRYETGLTTRLEFTDVNLALSRARLNRLRALRDYGQAINALRFAMGADVE